MEVSDQHLSQENIGFVAPQEIEVDRFELRAKKIERRTYEENS